ncbi:hypothetical protein [Spongiivirga citrea]|uniref:Histidine kinase N-terminal 7TM region domain-containing protein n=1 Tax=Spongiivirga citrea TaxID=1481457 RepID=A0A6M0CM85_9FLAO|nr:hypothetical protein [Spongiivirga citrea]NER19055.1 hypothetical protein [Spongiivirga citrea]
MDYYPNLHSILVALQGIAALIGLYYFKKLRKTHWEMFVIYLIVIFLQELFWTFSKGSIRTFAPSYYAYIGIPIQFLFFYWLYAYNSLKNRKLYFVFTIIYLVCCIPLEPIFGKIQFINSFNFTVGTLLLAFLVIIEFRKQIRDDKILEFNQNKMFYVNIGVTLFYIGTYPYYAFRDLLATEPYWSIRNNYYLYFLVANYLMYLLFTASFIWGKHRLK